ncbi:MAG TPA: hypothetical protein VN030_02960 [Cellvibrio sp.]|nr:hypothetical protein [Cellvibrio sp.]
MMKASIYASVGENTKTRDTGVRLIQNALSHIILQNILIPLVPFKTDGIVAKNSRLAIGHFIITRLLITLTFVFFALGCNAQTNSSTAPANANTSAVENAMGIFSTAVSNKDAKQFVSLTNPSGIYLVRLFTSGNLGSRGPELSESVKPATINEKLQFPIKDQTPFTLKIHFPELPIKSFKALPQRTLPAEIDIAHYDQWPPILKKALANTPEATTRSPIILSSNSGRYWLYTEAQIIDDALVGAFAVFSPEGDKLKLVAVIELL